jgi:hypothetical protein
MNEQQSGKPNSNKSRHQSHLEFFNALQIEFLQAEIRHKIYPRLKDKDYWKRVMDGKRKTIDEFSERNKIPSIFTDEAMRREFESKVYRDQSYPLFTYKNEQNKQEQEFYDLRYYYYPGSEVRVLVLGETKIGKVTKEFIPYQHSYIMVTIDGVEDKYPVSNVTRIL